MSNVSKPPEGGQVTDPSSANPTLRWNDPVQLRRWISLLRNQALDGFAAGKDAARRPSKRMFSRHEVKRRIKEAESAVIALLDDAERSLSKDEGSA